MIAQRTRKILWTRAADRCAICRCKLTQDPRHSSDREAVLGTECHIVARRRGGPRSGTISEREVDGYKNLILLCPTHHKVVDDQPNEYTVDALRAIKEQHEEWVDETLEWRSELPDALWEKVKEQAEALRLEHIEGAPEEVEKLVHGLGIYVVIAADELLADELLFLIRANAALTLGFKFRKGRVTFAYQAQGGFDLALSNYLDGPTLEDWSDSIRPLSEETMERADEDGQAIFELAASMLADTFERAGGTEAVVYVRAEPSGDLPQFAFHVEDGEVLAAAGPSETFDLAFDVFDRADAIDLTKSIRATMLMNTFEHRKEEDADERILNEFFANLFALSVLGVLDDAGSEPSELDDEKELFAQVLRDRFFEGLLVLEAANESLDDPKILAWVEENMDPEPPDGFSATLPNACRVAVEEFVAESEGVMRDEAELEEKSLELLHAAISRWKKLTKGSNSEAWLEELVPDRIEWWQEPIARQEILDLVEGPKKAA